MFINEPDGEIVQNLPLKEPQKQRTPLLLEEQGSTERQQWRCLLVKIRTFFDENPDCEI